MCVRGPYCVNRPLVNQSEGTIYVTDLGLWTRKNIYMVIVLYLEINSTITKLAINYM
jgi:hypothetical protein